MKEVLLALLFAQNPVLMEGQQHAQVCSELPGGIVICSDASAVDEEPTIEVKQCKDIQGIRVCEA